MVATFLILCIRIQTASDPNLIKTSFNPRSTARPNHLNLRAQKLTILPGPDDTTIRNIVGITIFRVNPKY